MPDPDAHDGARERGPNSPPNAAKRRGEPVERAEDAHRRRRVGQHDGGAREGGDDSDALDEHDGEEGGEADGGVLDESGEGGEDVDYGEGGG